MYDSMYKKNLIKKKFTFFWTKYTRISYFEEKHHKSKMDIMMYCLLKTLRLWNSLTKNINMKQCKNKYLLYIYSCNFILDPKFLMLKSV